MIINGRTVNLAIIDTHTEQLRLNRQLVPQPISTNSKSKPAKGKALEGERELPQTLWPLGQERRQLEGLGEPDLAASGVGSAAPEPAPPAHRRLPSSALSVHPAAPLLFSKLEALSPLPYEVITTGLVKPAAAGSSSPPNSGPS